MTKTAMTDPTDRIRDELVEMTRDLNAVGLMSDAECEKITLRHVGGVAHAIVDQLTGPEIRALREQARMSQAVFARSVGLTPGYVSQLERGEKRPSGPALVLFNLIKRRGIGPLLT